MAEMTLQELWSTASAADLAVCRAHLRNGSRSFYFASTLLPREISERACALYAFCRQVDDVVDDTGRGPDALPRLQRRLEAVYAGRPEPTPVDRAFSDVVASCGVPRALPEALLEGMTWDAQGRSYESLSDVLAYAARVASSVGAMMSVIMERQAPRTIARACELGVAMQLSNIARDVGEDARLGRLYLPRTWLREAGIDPDAWLAAPTFTPALGSVVLRLLDVAAELYARSVTGVSDLPRGCRPGIHLAARVYAAIGDEVRERGGDSVSSRAIVSTGRKAALVPGALRAAMASVPVDDAAPLPEICFLVEAVNGGRGSL